MNCLISDYNKSYYHDRFKDILSFNNDSSLWDIVLLKGNDYPGSENPIEASSFVWISTIIGKTFINSPDVGENASLDNRALKILRQKIKAWSTLLEYEREEALYKPEKLNAIQAVAKKIFQINKTSALIKNKLSEMKIADKKINKALARFDEMIDRILTTLPLQATKEEIPARSQHCYTFSRPFLGLPSFNFPQLIDYKPRIVLSPSEIEDLKAEIVEKRDMQNKERVIHNFSNINQNDDPLRQQHLVEAFKTLNSMDEIIAVTPTLTLEQITHILDHCFLEKENEWKLPYFLGSMPFNKLEKILLRNLAQPDLLKSLNAILCKIDDAAREWLDKAFCVLSVDFVLINTRKKDEIDALNREFRLRLELEPQKISFEDILKIGRLERNIHKHWQALKNLRILINRVLPDPETNHVLCELDKEYQLLLKRLNDEGPHHEGDGISSINFTAKMMPAEPVPEQISGGVETFLKFIISRFVKSSPSNNEPSQGTISMHILKSKSDQEQHQVIARLDNECMGIIIRLINEAAHRNEVYGYTYGIIHRKVFEKRECDDDMEATDILGYWGISSPLDHRDAGLVPNIPSEEFLAWQTYIKLREKNVFSRKSDNDEAVTWEHYLQLVRTNQNVNDIKGVLLPSREELNTLETFQSKVYKTANQNLRRLGIEKISDWKPRRLIDVSEEKKQYPFAFDWRGGIYNKNMLIECITSSKIRQILCEQPVAVLKKDC